MPAHIYNWKPSPPDPRDLVFKPKLMLRVVGLPSSASVQAQCSPVVDQGKLGSCTACAIVSGLREFLAVGSKQYHERLSRLFLYYEEREIEGTVLFDWGAYIKDGLDVLLHTGVCPEPLWPYDITSFAQTPTPELHSAAAEYKIKKYERVYGIEGVKACIAEGYPVVAGMDVFRQMEEEAGKTGVVSCPRTFDESLGGHAVTIVGYHDTPRDKPNYWKGGGWLFVRNSWGEAWGTRGYFKCAYAYVTRGFMSEFWTARA